MLASAFAAALGRCLGRSFGRPKKTGATRTRFPDVMARLYASVAVLLAALLLAGANAIIVGRVYRPVVATPFGASSQRAKPFRSSLTRRALQWAG